MNQPKPTDDITPPPLIIEVTVNGEKREIKMTYGLELDIRRVLPEPNEALRSAMIDPFAQDYIVRRCLTDKKGMITDHADLISHDDFEISSEDTHGVVLWCVEHALHFFAIRAASLTELTAQYQVKAPTPLTPIPNGSEPSPSPTPSVGPSE